MKKILLFTTVAFLSFCSIYAQTTCRDGVRAVYKEIFSKNLRSITLNWQEYSADSLCLGFSKSQINVAIDNAKIYSNGCMLDSIVEINLNQQILIFVVSVEKPDPCEVLDIYDSNGLHLLYLNDYLLFPAITNDPDGYVNIRKEKNVHSPVVGKIKRNQIFFFTPSQTSNWYRAYSKYGGGAFCGYVHKSKILPYEKCPRKIRRHMEKLLFC